MKIVLISTKHKIEIARIIYCLVMGIRRLLGRGPEVEVVRQNIRWSLDLREGIDLAIYLFGRFDSQTIEAYRPLIRPGDLVVDIGANMGAHTLWLARCVGDTGKVIAFEPTTGAFRRLQRNIKLNPELKPRIIVRQAMLVAQAGEPPAAAIYASWRVDGTQSENAHPLHLGTPISTAGAESLTFDQALDGYGRIALIKLDVDGYELDVMRGALTVLRRDRPHIVMELAPYTIRERGQHFEELVALLQDLGYHFYSLAGRPMTDFDAQCSNIPRGSSLNIVARFRAQPISKDRGEEVVDEAIVSEG